MDSEPSNGEDKMQYVVTVKVGECVMSVSEFGSDEAAARAFLNTTRALCERLGGGEMTAELTKTEMNARKVGKRYALKRAARNGATSQLRVSPYSL